MVMRAFLLIGMALLWNVDTQAQTQSQKNVMNHIAQVIALSNKCNSLEPNNLLMAMVLSNNKIDIEQSPFKEYIYARGIEHQKASERYSVDIVCHTGKVLYGKNGSNVPGLLR